jgi:hypothetical protein
MTAGPSCASRARHAGAGRPRGVPRIGNRGAGIGTDLRASETTPAPLRRAIIRRPLPPRPATDRRLAHHGTNTGRSCFDNRIGLVSADLAIGGACGALSQPDQPSGFLRYACSPPLPPCRRRETPRRWGPSASRSRCVNLAAPLTRTPVSLLVRPCSSPRTGRAARVGSRSRGVERRSSSRGVPPSS